MVVLNKTRMGFRIVAAAAIGATAWNGHVAALALRPFDRLDRGAIAALDSTLSSRYSRTTLVLAAGCSPVPASSSPIPSHHRHGGPAS